LFDTIRACFLIEPAVRIEIHRSDGSVWGRTFRAEYASRSSNNVDESGVSGVENVGRSEGCSGRVQCRETRHDLLIPQIGGDEGTHETPKGVSDEIEVTQSPSPRSHASIYEISDGTTNIRGIIHRYTVSSAGISIPVNYDDVVGL
jgi:hypothetical protein